MTTEVITFHWADYLVFVLFLLFSAALGAFIGYRNRKKATTGDFLMGGRDMHYIPVALSMQASFLSAIFILGIPSEIYSFGMVYSYLALSYWIGLPIASYMYLPILHKLKLTSAYEYLERRFNRTVRLAGSVTFCFMVVLYMSVVLYTPALALAQVTGLSLVASILGCGAVCTFYTAMGGMKATIWNDAIQMTVVAICLFLLIILGTVDLGGPSVVWEAAKNGSRLEFNNFDPDPTIRTTFWTQTVGGTAIHVCLYASSQTIIQKFLSIGKLKDAQKSVWVSSFSTTVFLALVCGLGLVMYAYYSTCDPLAVGRVTKTDQLVALYVMEVFGDLHGLPGLFLATTFSAALSSVSGSLNALAAVCLVDFIQPVYLKKMQKKLNEKTATLISRLLATFFGIVTIGMGFAAELMGDTVIAIAMSIFGFVGGPLAALLTLGIFFPYVNSIGAFWGLLISLVLTSWIGIGTVVAKIPNTMLPIDTSGCPVGNITETIATTFSMVTQTTMETPTDDDGALWIYKVSFMWYGWIALFIAIAVAIPLSWATGWAKSGRDYDSELIYSFVDECCCCCPTKCLDCMRCGHDPYYEDEDDVVEEKHVNELGEIHPKIQSISSSRSAPDVAGVEKNGIRNKGYTPTTQTYHYNTNGHIGENSKPENNKLSTFGYV